MTNIDETIDGKKALASSESGMSQSHCGNAVDNVLAAIAKLPIPPTAKYVGTIMVTMRLIDSKSLADFTGIPLRSVQRAITQISASGVIGATSGAPLASSAPPVASEQAPRVHAPAQMEYPTGISSYEKVASKAHEEVEIVGLNGSTGRFVDMLAGWLAGDLRPKEPDVARAILAGNVEHYGADKVKAGMLELQVAIGTGQKPRDPGKAFSGFVKNAKPPRADEAPKLSKVDERIAKARALMSPEARASAEARNGRLAS